jgi:hypothetical protein
MHPFLSNLAIANAFPPLQELHINLKGSCGIKIIRHCSQTLVKLGFRFLTFVLEDEKPSERIELPLLKHLSYIYFQEPSHPARLFPVFITPNLESYHEHQPESHFVLHEHTISVKKLLIDSSRVIEWAQFPQLTTLTLLRDIGQITDDCRYLKDHLQVCPRLESVRCILLEAVNLADSREAERHLVERSEQANKKIEFKFILEDEIEDEDLVEYSNVGLPFGCALVHFLKYFQCYTYCSAHGNIGDVYSELFLPL